MSGTSHGATVYENRGTRRYDPFVIDKGSFLVGCSCGWYSAQVNSEEDAFTLAKAHCEYVNPEVQPLFPE